MRTKYIITKSSFLEGWAITSPADHEGKGEGSVCDSLPEALAWMDTHAMTSFERFYDMFTVPEPGAIMEGSEW